LKSSSLGFAMSQSTAAAAAAALGSAPAAAIPN